MADDVASKASGPESRTAFLVVDIETIPDGRLLKLVKYPKEPLGDDEAIRRAQTEARERSRDGSDFVSLSFQYPVAVCVIRVGPDLLLQRLTSLDAPQYRPRQIVKQFWEGLSYYNASLVTFNGRGFDLPVLELAAFRYGLACGRDYFSRNRPREGHFDIMAWLNNFGACHHSGGLNLLAKMLGKPGKMEHRGDQVLTLHQAGKFQEINDYCMFDTLDTYFVFLRTRVLLGELTLEAEQELVQRAKEFLLARVAEFPGLQRYLDNWGDWSAWP